MQELIARLETWLCRNRPDYYKVLEAGASEQEISALETELNLTLPDEFKVFLSWKNGQQGEQKLYGNYCLLSTQEIAGFWKSLNQWQDNGDFEVVNWWHKGWIPFLYDFSGNHCCIDTAAILGGKANQIITYWHDDNERTIIHENFLKWLETLVLALE